MQAIYYSRRYLPMPAPHSNEPQAGWQVTIGLLSAGAGAVLGAIVNQVGVWRQELIKQRTATQQREQDKEEAYTDNLRGDLERLTVRFDALVRQREAEALERVTKESQLEVANIEQKRRIAHLETVIEQLEFKISRFEGDKLEYEKMLAQKDAVIEEQKTMIEDLQEQVAKSGIIGTTETDPTQRQVPRVPSQRLIPREERGE